MKRALWIGATLGFLMPVFWGFASFALFNLPDGPAADLYWRLNHIFCPFYSMPTVFELSLTAFLYALLGALVAIAIHGFTRRKAA